MNRIIHVLLLTCLSVWAYAQTYPIGHRSASFTDATRSNRTVTADVYYPATVAGNNTAVATGKFPIVVFGHGFVMAYTEYDYLYNYLAQNGFVVIMATTETSFSPSHDNFGKDLAFLVTKYYAENANSNSPFYNKLILKSAVMGHSMGGGAAFLAAANNNNVTTLVTFAAAETNPSAIAAAANVQVPSLTLAGTLDCVTPSADHHLPMYNAIPSAFKFYVSIINGSHCRFGKASAFSSCVTGEGFSCGGTSSSFLSTTEQNNQVKSLVLPWLQFFLKGNCVSGKTFKNYIDNNNNTKHTYQTANTLPAVAVSIAQAAPSGGAILLSSTISSGIGCKYQWFKNNVAITGATQPTYSATTNGNYKLRVRNGMNLSSFSNIIAITTLTNLADDVAAKTTDEPLQYTLYPNPATDLVQVQLYTETPQSYTLQLTSVEGKLVEQRTVLVHGEAQVSFDVTRWAAGIYTLRIAGTEGVYTEKIIKY
jgi:dienelactone hydrolase